MQMYWWNIYGSFPSDESGFYPDKVAVIEHYLRLKEWTHKRLAEALGCTRRYVVYMLNRRMGLDSISVLRRLIVLLDISPVLLGLDSQFLSRQCERLWWIDEGYPPLPPGKDGYPDMGKMIVYYRREQRKTMPNGKIRPWSQVDLGTALGGTPTIMIRKYEKGRAVDSLERRRALMHILGIPAVLLGLDGLQHLAPTQMTGPSLQLSGTFKPDRALITDYESAQGVFWHQYFTQHGHHLVPEVKQWIAHLGEITPLIGTTKDYCRAIVLQATYQQLLGDLGTEQCNYPFALSHMSQAITLAESIDDDTLLTVGLLRRAAAFYEANDFEHAHEDIESVLSLVKDAPYSLQAIAKIDAARIYSRAAQSDMMRWQAQKLLEQGWNALQKSDLSEDPYHLRVGPDLFHIKTIQVSLALHTSRLPTLGKALEAIEKADRETSITLKRRRALIEIFQAQVLFIQKEYAATTEKALGALTLSEEIKSYRCKQLITELYEKLAATNYGGPPQVACLKLKLQQWGKGK